MAEIARRVGLRGRACSGWPMMSSRRTGAHWQPNPGRRGQNLLILTGKGRRAITELTTEQHAWADTVGQEIGEKNLKTLGTLINRLTDASRRYRQAAGEESSPEAGDHSSRSGPRADT